MLERTLHNTNKDLRAVSVFIDASIQYQQNQAPVIRAFSNFVLLDQ